MHKIVDEAIEKKRGKVLKVLENHNKKASKKSQVCLTMFLNQRMASYYLSNGKIDSAQYFITKAKQLTEENNIKEEYHGNIMFLAYVLDEKDKKEQAIDLYKKAETYYKATPDTLSLAQSYINMAAILMELKNNETALKYLESAEVLLSKHNYYFEAGAVYENLAQINAELGYEQKCLRQMHNAIRNYKKLDNKNYLAEAYSATGVSYKNLKKYDSARIYYDKAEKLAHDLNNQFVLAQVLLNRGNLLDILNDDNAAIECYRNSLKICKQHKINIGIYLNYINLAELFINKNEHREAKTLLNNALNININNQFGHNREVYENLYIVSKETHNYKEAVDYAEKIMDIKDSVHNAHLESKVLEIQERYESEKMKSKLYKLRAKEQKRELNQIIFIGITIIIILTMVFVIYFVFSKYRSHKQKAKLSIKEKEKIQIQLESHKRELLSKSYQVNKMQDFYNNLFHKLNQIKNKSDNISNKEYNEIIRFVQLNPNLKDASNDLKNSLLNVNSKLAESLKNNYPEITQSELQICMFLYLGMTTKEIANATNRSSRTISNFRYRIRKKMNLDGKTDLSGHIQQIASENT